MKPSPQQEAIFAEFKNGRSHFVVEARAGTGKTSTIKVGLPFASEDKKVYLCFNRRNVLEAKEAITDPTCQIMSLNGLGHRFVAQNWKGVEPNDDVEFDRIKAVIANSPGLKKLTYPPLGAIRDIVGFAKNIKPFAKYKDLLNIAEHRGFEAEERQEKRGWTTEVFCSVAEGVMELSKKQDRLNRISFNDQIWLPIVMKWARPWFNLVVVDECQDMNATQLLLARAACKPSGRMVLVGDPRQAIYGFRGADVNGMERLKTELRAKVFPLTTTYRCAKNIVELAKKLVPDYTAADFSPDGEISRISITKAVEAARPGDAIVSRTNAPLTKLCLDFLKVGIRAYIEGRDVGASLLSLHKRFADAPTMKTYLEAVDTWAADRISKVTGEPESDTYKATIQAIRDQAETIMAIGEESDSPAGVEQRLRGLFEDSDKDRNPKPAIVLSSVHKAKGLEWNKVFLVEETFKHCTWSPYVSENNNIAYVAVTRAKRELVWLAPETTHQTETVK